MILSPLKCFDVTVELAGGFSVKHRVIAADSDHAEELVREAMEKEPPLTRVESIRTRNPNGNYIEPMIISL